MSLADSIYTVLQAAAITIPSAFDAVTDRMTLEVGNRRIERFATKVVEHARVKVDVVGAENVPSSGAFVFMSNHQSHFDIPVLYYSLPIETLRMVGKTELFRIPLWGRAMRAGGMIEVDRSDRAAAIESLKRAADAIRGGVSIFIAPEGHRSPDGKLGPLKKGGFHLARDAAAEIIPVALDNTGEILRPGTIAMKSGVAVTVTIGEPIPTEGREIEELMTDVEAFLRAHVSDA